MKEGFAALFLKNGGKNVTIIEAINRIDILKPNTYTQIEKVRWLSTLDGIIKKEIIDTHEGFEAVVFNGYDDTTPVTTELLVPSPYDEIYLYYLESKIDYFNGEYGRYNNSITMYNNALNTFEKYYNKQHRPTARKRFIF
jgi:hypothetical protein